MGGNGESYGLKKSLSPFISYIEISYLTPIIADQFHNKKHYSSLVQSDL